MSEFKVHRAGKYLRCISNRGAFPLPPRSVYKQTSKQTKAQRVFKKKRKPSPALDSIVNLLLTNFALIYGLH